MGRADRPYFLLKACASSLLGKYEKLSLSAWPSPMVPLEQNVTLRCHSRSPLNRFRLFKTDGKRRLPELQGYYFNNFTLGPVTKEHAGSYMCSVANWSALSDPLQIVVTGKRGPAQPETPMPAGNATLGTRARAAQDFLRIPSQDRTRDREPTLRV